MEIDLTENKKRAKLYFSEGVFTFLREFTPSGETRYYNGFIDEVKEDLFMFFDIELKRTFPVPIDRCIIDICAKVGITEKEALKIYENWKKEGVGE